MNTKWLRMEQNSSNWVWMKHQRFNHTWNGWKLMESNGICHVWHWCCAAPNRLKMLRISSVSMEWLYGHWIHWELWNAREMKDVCHSFVCPSYGCALHMEVFVPFIWTLNSPGAMKCSGNEGWVKCRKFDFDWMLTHSINKQQQQQQQTTNSQNLTPQRTGLTAQ